MQGRSKLWIHPVKYLATFRVSYIFLVYIKKLWYNFLVYTKCKMTTVVSSLHLIVMRVKRS